jgi:hypothetical protein
MDNSMLSNFISALYGVIASAVIIFFRDRIIELYNSTFYGKLLDEEGYKKKSSSDFYYTTNCKFDSGIPLESIKFTIKQGKYEMSEHIPDSETFERIAGVFKFYRIYCKIKGIQLFNGKVARLNRISISGNEIEIETQKLEYYDYIKSHLLADAYLRNFYHFRRSKEYKTFRDYINSKQDLYLELARTLGINILAVTRDRKIILQKRSNKTNIYGGTTYPSASGSVEYMDSIVLSQADSAMKKVILGKELFEEVAIFPTDIQDMQLIGLYEDNYRLRLPDMFFVATISNSFQEVKNKYERDLSKDRFETEKIKGIGIDEFFNMDDKALSQPLRVYKEEKELIMKYLNMKNQ